MVLLSDLERFADFVETGVGAAAFGPESGLSKRTGGREAVSLGGLSGEGVGAGGNFPVVVLTSVAGFLGRAFTAAIGRVRAVSGDFGNGTGEVEGLDGWGSTGAGAVDEGFSSSLAAGEPPLKADSNDVCFGSIDFGIAAGRVGRGTVVCGASSTGVTSLLSELSFLGTALTGGMGNPTDDSRDFGRGRGRVPDWGGDFCDDGASGDEDCPFSDSTF